MKVCSVCQRCYEDAVFSCTEENHEELAEARPGSREIVANHRLDFLIEQNQTGETYRATNTVVNQPCLIRIIAGDEQKFNRQFLNEARLAAALIHPNVARLYESGTLEGGEFYVVTEEVDGQTLRNCLSNVGAPTEITALMITRQTAEGLEAIHKAGLKHRGLSPENIILASDAENRLLVKIQNLDFGGLGQKIATSSIYDSEQNLNKLRYFSPEQCAGQTVDERSDIYSLGIVLYEMLAGHPPFDAPAATALKDKQINEPLPPAHISNFEIRALLTHTLTDSLQKLPRVRLKTANALARQLRHIEQLATHSSTPPPVMAYPSTLKKQTGFLLKPKVKAAPVRLNNSFQADSATPAIEPEIVKITATEPPIETEAVFSLPEAAHVVALSVAEIVSPSMETLPDAAEVVSPLMETEIVSFSKDTETAEFSKETETVTFSKETEIVSLSPPEPVVEAIAAENIVLQTIPAENEPASTPEPMFFEKIESFVEEEEIENFGEEAESPGEVWVAAQPVFIEWEQPEDIPSELEVIEARREEFGDRELAASPVFLEEAPVIGRDELMIEEAEPMITEAEPVMVATEPVIDASAPQLPNAFAAGEGEEYEEYEEFEEFEEYEVDEEYEEYEDEEAGESRVRAAAAAAGAMLSGAAKSAFAGSASAVKSVFAGSKDAVKSVFSGSNSAVQSIFSGKNNVDPEFAPAYPNNSEFAVSESKAAGGFLTSNRSLVVSMALVTIFFSAIIAALVNPRIESAPVSGKTTAKSVPDGRSLSKPQDGAAVSKDNFSSTAKKTEEPIPADQTAIEEKSETIDYKVPVIKENQPLSSEESVSPVSKRSSQNRASKEIPETRTAVKQTAPVSRETTSKNRETKPKTAPEKKPAVERQTTAPTKSDIFTRPRVVKNPGR